MSTLVFLVEEPSMKELLDGLLPRVVPADVQVHVIPHRGKSDLEASIPRKLKGWGTPGARFVVLIDQDSNDCKKLKGKIASLCKDAHRDGVLVRIVCRSLEAWVLGELPALAKAFDAPAIAGKGSVAKYRTPDKLGDPVGEIRALLPGYGKVAGARAVGPHLSVEAGANQSRSFQVFLDGLRKLLAA